MENKIDELFNPNTKSTPYSNQLEFKIADISHIDEVLNLMSIRNPSIDREKILL